MRILLLLLLKLLLLGLSEDFLFTDRVTLDVKRFDILLLCDSVKVLLVKSVAFSSTLLALANNLFSINLDLLFDFDFDDPPPCLDNLDGLVINISIFFVCEITWFCDLNLRSLLLEAGWFSIL